ncbi:dCMP deaminase [Paragonimus westermani]|uniref:dCMP deaminase n=1 Tax=Paragonimus westermani TaxID=34504 RepID=A0A5J4NEK7_9TREM|nr:dCMP deaminase [Paragonimus westermani]
MIGICSNQEGKRKDYISWDEYFMSIALLSARRSKDPATQVGACIINQENKIVGIGYNGMPNGLSDDEMPWGKGSDDALKNKYLFVCHAELNAVLNKNSASSSGCTLYSSLFPCNECAKVLIQAGIKEVVYFSDENKKSTAYDASRLMFEKAGIRVRPFDRTGRQINLDLG